MADPDERTAAERIDATRRAARSLMLLLEAIERGELVATPLEIAQLQGAVEALDAIAGELPADGRWRPLRSTVFNIDVGQRYFPSSTASNTSSECL
jgi:hypothetical protein